MSTPNLKEDTPIKKNGKNWEGEIRTLFFEGEIRTLFFEGEIGPCGSRLRIVFHISSPKVACPKLAEQSSSKDDRYPLKKLYRRIRHNHISKVLLLQFKSRASSKSFLECKLALTLK